MIAQRAPASAPCVRAFAEQLPFHDGTFDAGLAVLTIHHWSDWRAGLRELIRVTRRRVVIFTWDPESDGFWLLQDYMPAMIERDRQRFPGLGALREELGDIQVQPVPLPHDCTDGFWARTGGASAACYSGRDDPLRDFQLRARGLTTGTARLAADLADGAWARKHGDLLERTELDLGCRLVVAALA